MKLNKYYIALMFLMLWHCSFSQQYTNYTTKDGLPSNHVYRVTQDNKGFVWFITDKGMVRYNGASFKTFTTKEGLSTNDIWDIRITPDNKVWFFSKSDKLGYIDNDDVFAFASQVKGEVLYPVVINQNVNTISFSNSIISYTLNNKYWQPTNLEAKNGFQEILLHKRVSKFVVTEDSMFVEDKQNKIIDRLVKPRILKTMHQRTQVNDSLFVWANDEEYTIYNLNNLTLYKREFKNQLGLNTTKFVRVSAVNNQVQFSGKDFVGFMDKNYNLSKTIVIPSVLNSHYSFIDKDDNLWIATFNNGVYFIAAAKRRSRYLLNGQKIGGLTQIKNNIIANVYNKGFYRYDYNSDHFKTQIAESDFMYSVNQIKELNTTYYCTNRRIISEKNGLRHTFEYRNDVNETARKLVYFNSQLYGDSSFGVNLIDPTSMLPIETYQQNGVRDMIVFKNKLLIATSNGLRQLDNTQFQFVFPQEIKFNKPIISLKEVESNKLLIGTDGFGAYITDLKKIHLIEKTEFLSVQDAFIKEDQLWLATNEGVWHYKEKNNTYRLLEKYSINQGLSTQVVNSVFVWDDQIMVGTNDGVCVVPIEKTSKSSSSKIYIDKLEYNKRCITKLETIRYTSDNTLDVSIAEIDFRDVKDLTYDYQLIPIHEKWLTTSSKQISFNDLQPNTYNLIIKKGAVNQSFQFTISPLWWQTSFFKIGARLLFISLLLFFAWRIRKRELKKKTTKLNREKEMAEYELYALRSQMNPHFVFNSLNAIQYYITDNKIELSEKYLVKFSKLIRMFFDFSQSKLVSVKEEVELLNAYLEIEKLRFGDEFKFVVKVDQTILERKIPSMLLQPIVENAVNHGLFHKQGKGTVSVFFKSINQNSFEVIIEDDGVGRKKSKEIYQNNSNKHRRKSGMILQDRIDLLNLSKQCRISYHISDLDVETNRGTHVYIKFETL